MRVTLIYPSLGGRIRAPQMPPLTMAALGALTPPDAELRFYDDRVEEVPLDEPTDLVGISAQTFTARRAYELARAFRARGVPVVLGGFHVAAAAEEAAREADAVVLGEAEELWPRVVQDARAGRLQPLYRAQSRPSLQGLRYRRDLFAGKPYLPLHLVEFGRGCAHACSFCSVAGYFGPGKRCRPAREVLSEIEALPPGRLFFVDDSLAADAGATRELLEGLVGLRRRWIGQAGLELADDDRLLELAAASGCDGLLIGFESLSAGGLRQTGKAAHQEPRRYEEAVAKLHSRGIRVCASFLLGLDDDGPDAFESTLAFALGHRFLLALFNHLTPFPGTPIYGAMRQAGRLPSERWWLEPGMRWGEVIFEPKRLSAAQVSEGCWRTRRSFYSSWSIARRVLGPANRRRPLESLVLNLLVRRDLREKRGFPLGRNP